MIFRAERDIGYGGSVCIRKRTFTKGENFDGLYIKDPEDLIEFEAIGNCEGSFPACDYSFRPGGIKLKKPKDKAVIIYWALTVDGYGNPVTTFNHMDAVIAYIIWKLYSPKVFLGIGHNGIKHNYKEEYTNEMLAARGDDAFPTIEQYAALGHYSTIDRRILFKADWGYNFCDESIKEDCEVIETENKIYYWQLNSLSETITDVIEAYDQDQEEYFKNIPFAVDEFTNGLTVSYDYIGKICFAIKNTVNQNWNIYDVLGNNVTDTVFDKYYHVSTKTLFYVSKINYVPLAIFFRISQ